MLVHTNHLVPGMRLEKDIELEAGSYLITCKELGDQPLNEEIIKAIRKFSRKLAPYSHKVFIADDKFALGYIKKVVDEDLKRIAEEITSSKDIPNFLADVDLNDKVMRVMDMMFTNPDIVRTMYDSRYNSNSDDKPLNLLLDHSIRVSLLSVALGLRLNSTIISLMCLGIAALLHDMGILVTSVYPDMESIDEMSLGVLDKFIEDHQTLSADILKQRKLELNLFQRKEIYHIVANHHHPEYNEQIHKNTLIFHLADLVDEMVSKLPHSIRYNFSADQIEVLGKKYSRRTGLVNVLMALIRLHRGKGVLTWKIVTALAGLFEMNGLMMGDFEDKLKEIIEACPFSCARTNPPATGNHLPRTIYCGNSLDQDFSCVHLGHSKIEVQREEGHMRHYTRCATLSDNLHAALTKEKT
jgi:HD domain